MKTQLVLEFERPAEQGPVVTRADVETVISNLRGKRWQTSRQLGFETEADKRILRAIAEASAGEILSGQKGYMLTREATPNDLKQAGWLKSQGEKMIDRWTAIQRVWHRAPQPQP
jgi:hypothetical protein